MVRHRDRGGSDRDRRHQRGSDRAVPAVQPLRREGVVPLLRVPAGGAVVRRQAAGPDQGRDHRLHAHLVGEVHPRDASGLREVRPRRRARELGARVRLQRQRGGGRRSGHEGRGRGARRLLRRARRRVQDPPGAEAGRRRGRLHLRARGLQPGHARQVRRPAQQLDLPARVRAVAGQEPAPGHEAVPQGDEGTRHRAQRAQPGRVDQRRAAGRGHQEGRPRLHPPVGDRRDQLDPRLDRGRHPADDRLDPARGRPRDASSGLRRVRRGQGREVHPQAGARPVSPSCASRSSRSRTTSRTRSTGPRRPARRLPRPRRPLDAAGAAESRSRSRPWTSSPSGSSRACPSAASTVSSRSGSS